MLKTIASLVAGDQERGRQVTGSIAVPRTQPTPIPAQTAPVSALGPARCDRAAAMTAARGIGHGAATPAPQPASSPRGNRQRDADATGLARKLVADRHRAAHNGCTGECERSGKQQRPVRIRAHQMLLSVGAGAGQGDVRLPIGDLAPGGR